MEELQILIFGIIVGMCIFWFWWKISKIKDSKKIAQIFDDIEKDMSKRKGARVIISDEVRELVKLRAKSDMFEEQDKNKE